MRRKMAEQPTKERRVNGNGRRSTDVFCPAHGQLVSRVDSLYRLMLANLSGVVLTLLTAIIGLVAYIARMPR
jgi:hypothetical protein